MCFTYHFTLKAEGVSSSETLVNVCLTTPHHISENNTYVLWTSFPEQTLHKIMDTERHNLYSPPNLV